MAPWLHDLGLDLGTWPGGVSIVGLSLGYFIDQYISSLDGSFSRSQLCLLVKSIKLVKLVKVVKWVKLVNGFSW